MPSTRGLVPAALLLAIVACLPRPLEAQSAPTLDRSLVQKTSPLTVDELRQIDRYVDHYLAALQQAEEADAAVRARDRLIEPFELGGTPSFVVAYSSALSRKLVAVASTTEPIVGVNAMIVAAKLVDPGAIDLIRTGLSNQQNLVVRYWAAKNIETLINAMRARDAAQPTPADQRKLLEAITSAAQSETNDYVSMHLLPAITSLTIPEAPEALVGMLDRRLASHAANPRLPIGPEAQSMQRLYQQLVSAQLNNRPIDMKLVRELARVAFRYLSLSVELLAAGTTGPATDDYVRMRDVADATLRWAAPLLDPAVKLPAKVADAGGNANRLRVIVADWQVILSKPPYSFTAQDLQLEAAAP